MKITKAIIPVAGWGTRSLPASKNVPKEMLPIHNKPAIQYIAEEVVASQLEGIVFITNKEKTVIEDHFDYNLLLEDVLRKKDRLHLIQSVYDIIHAVTVSAVRQKEQKGLGHAVLCAEHAVVNEDAFAVLLGDDLFFSSEPILKQLIETTKKTSLPAIGVVPVPKEDLHKYGVISINEMLPDGSFSVSSLVEKPSADQAPSNYAVVGRYVLTPDIFTFLRSIAPDASGEMQLTDALNLLAKEKGLIAVPLKGQRFDIGDQVEYILANVHFALKDSTIAHTLRQKLDVLLGE